VAPGGHGHRQAVVARLACDGARRRGPWRRPVRRLRRTGRRRLAALSSRQVSISIAVNIWALRYDLQFVALQLLKFNCIQLFVAMQSTLFEKPPSVRCLGIQ
jgi:hypothetical protein